MRWSRSLEFGEGIAVHFAHFDGDSGEVCVLALGEEVLEGVGHGLADLEPGRFWASGEKADGEVDEAGGCSGASLKVLVDVCVGFDGGGVDRGAVGEGGGEVG